MLHLLPKCVQLIQNERSLEYDRLTKRLEKTLIENSLYRLSVDIRSLQSFYSVHCFNKEEKEKEIQMDKEKLFALLIEYSLQKYVYSTKHLFQTSWIPKRIKFFLSSIIKTINDNIEIKYEDLQQIYGEVDQNGLDATFDNADQQIIRGIQCLQEFFGLFRNLIPSSYYPLLIDKYLQGENLNHKLFRVDKSEPISTYKKSFEMLIEFKKYSYVMKQMDSVLIAQLICCRPDLPIDNYLDFLLEDIYNSFIVLLLNVQNQTNRNQIKIPQGNMRPSEFIQPLVYLIGSSQIRNKVWDTIERMFLVISDLIHPNNATTNDFVFSFFYIFVKAFVERVQAQKDYPEKNQEQENILDNNVFTKDEQLLEKDEETNEVNEEEEEDELEVDEDNNDKDKIFEKKEFMIDQEGIDKFISIVKPHLKYLIYQKSKYKKQVAGIYQSLCILKPKEILPYLMEQIQLALERDDIKPLLIIYIIEKIFQPAIKFDQYPQIINYIPFILRQTTNFIFENGEYIWRFYDILFQHIPIYDIKDLEIEYPNLNLKEEMLIEEISDLALEAFRKYVSTFEYSDLKYHRSQRGSEILFSSRNKFYNFIFQCSKSNYKEIVNILCNYLDDKILNNLSDNFVLVLQAIILRDPNVLKDVLTIIENQLLRKTKDHFEFNISNITTIRNYLIIIYEIIQFTGGVNKQYYQKFKCIIDLSLKHEETKIQQAGQNILESLLMSQAVIHIKDFQFTNDPKVQLDWLKLKQKGKNEKYLPKWQDIDDQEFIKQIMDDYYYPSLQQIREIIAQKKENQSFLDYLQNDFLQQYEQQYQLDSKQSCQQIELKIRKILSLNIDTIHAFLKPLYFRMKQYDENSSEVFKKFQDQYCFAVLNNMYDEIIKFCIDFVPVYVNNGLAIDVKLATSFTIIIKLLMHDTSDKIYKLGQWLQVKTRQSDTNKNSCQNRFQAQMLYTYLLNNRIDQIYRSQIRNQQNKEFFLISIPFLFDSNEFNCKFNYIWLQRRMELLEDREWLCEFFIKFYEQLKTVFKNKWFNVQYIESLNETEKQKLSLFQNHFTKGFANFVSTVSNLYPGMFLESYQIFDGAQQNLIDKVNRAKFNQILLNLIKKISQACVELNEADFERKNILIIKNQEIQKYVDCIFEQRIQHWQEQQIKISRNLESLNERLYQIVELWLNIPLDAVTSQQLITNGCALLLMRTDSLPQFNERVILKAFNCCISQELNIRSLGKLLLYRLIQIGVFKNKTYKYKYRKPEDFKNANINLEQYNIYRFILPEDQIYYKLNEHHRKGKILLYNQLKYTDIKREEVKKEFKILKSISSEQWHQFINLMIIDQSVLDQFQINQDKKSLANLFNDVDNLANEQFFYYSYMKAPIRFNLSYKKVQFLKYLFAITDYELFNHTKDLIDQNNLDQQSFSRIYLSGLLHALHSSWDCQCKQEIIDYCINKFEKIIMDQSKDEFKTFQYILHFAQSRCDLKIQEQFLQSLVDQVQKKNAKKKLRWIQLFYVMIESKKHQQIKLLDEILQTNFDYSNLKAAQTFIPLIIDQQNKYPHNIELLQELGLIEQFTQQTSILFKSKYFIFENSELFTKGLDILVNQFQEQNINCKINIIETLFLCWNSKKFIINPYIFQKIQPIVEYLLTINEENNLQQLTKGLQIFSNIRFKESTIALIKLTLDLLKVSSNTVRVRQLKFLKNLTKEILHINRAEILENIEQYLQDENKVVMQSCFDLTTQLIQQMTLKEVNCQLEICLKQSTNKETELIGKQVLMAMIMAHPRYTQPWINQVLKVILEKQNKLLQQQKTFAANYLKLYRANQLMEIEEVQINIEFIQKMSELSNPYNYFA
ncbi:unnamed protein product [Paramecium sonneborni]|uniref:Uncharacterized protein n=1 Tax=Paramecium sonneborni TaxID=65129 RepID=A0A8S1PSN0_9CILI|nr:unnamed protein product [Paramecium sonneborni]